MITIPARRKLPVSHVAFVPGSRLVAAIVGQKEVGVWDIDGGGKPARETTLASRGLELFANPRHVFFSTWDRMAAWDLATGAEFDLPGLPANTSGVCISADGTRLLLGRVTDGYYGGEKAVARVEQWDVSGDTPHMLWRTPTPVPFVRKLAFLPGGTQFLARIDNVYAAAGHTFAVGSLADGTWVGEPRKVPDKGQTTLVTANGWHLISAEKNWLAVRDWATGGPVKEIKNPDGRSYFEDIAMHPSGAFFATASLGGAVQFWDAATFAPTTRFDCSLGKARCVAFSPDGLLCAAGGDKGQIVVWDVD